MNSMHITGGFAAFALMASSGLQAAMEMDSFQILDTDANGYISADEATSNQALSTQWTALDKDSDNQLDKSEFSAFEIDADIPEGGKNLMRDDTMQQGTTVLPTSPME